MEILTNLELAIKKRNPVLVEKYLQPGLSAKALTKRFNKISGFVEPLLKIYSWHDGTRFVQLVSGETYATGIAKVSFFPNETYVFKDSEQAVAMMDTWKQAAKHQPALKEGVNRYFPVFCGSNGQFLLDLEPSLKGRVIYFDDEKKPFYQQAYASFDEFLVDILRANEANASLGFFARQSQIQKW